MYVGAIRLRCAIFLVSKMFIVGGQNLYGLFLNWSERVVSEI